MEEENKKKRIMWIAICVVMIFILFFWLNNFKTIMADSQINKNQEEVNLSTISDDFKESISTISETLEDLDINNEASSSAEVQELQQRVNELEEAVGNKIASSTCPEYINCMPGPDFDGDCQIPSGCEDITIIAY
jgi:peptidoglycan hydrolase CwlO-like protein